MNDLFQTVKSYVDPPEKTAVEQCTDYIKANPGTVAKGAAVGVVAWYTVPIAVGAIGWLPYLGIGYYIYNNTRTVQHTYSWYDWAREKTGNLF